MKENHYRASQFCRVLGNPTAYQIIKLLKKGRATPTALAKKIGLSVRTISDTLRHLRQINLVRYETNDKHKFYFLKDKSLQLILSDIEQYVEKMRRKRW